MAKELHFVCALTAQVPDIGDFMRQHTMQCPMALQRLVVVGVPATVQHGGNGSGRGRAGSSTAQVRPPPPSQTLNPAPPPTYARLPWPPGHEASYPHCERMLLQRQRE